MSIYLAIDIGGSSIKYSCINEECQLSHKGRTDTPRDSKENLFKKIYEIVQSIDENIEGIAISMPGVIDRKNGFAYSGGALEYLKDVDLVNELELFLKKPVTICNDAKAATYAELGFGNLKGVKNGLILVLGTGIGGGIVINGDVYEGSHFASGEVSSINGNLERNCDYFYTFSGTNGIYGLSKEILKQTGEENLSGIEIFKRIREGDINVLKGVEIFCKNLAFHIFNLQAILDVDCILIGGGISEEPMLIDILKEKVKYQFENQWNVIVCPEIKACRYNNDSNLIGAFYNFQLIKKLI